VQADDVIHVGPIGQQVAVIGSVNRPAIFELKRGETMVDVLRMPDHSFGSVPTPAIVAPIEFTMQLADYAALGGHMAPVRPLAELQSALDAAEVPATRIYTMADIFADRHFREREMLVRTPDDDLGAVTLAGVVPRLSGTPGHVRWSGHRPGQDTRAVLRRLTTLGDADIGQLEAEGVVCCDPQGRASASASTARTD